MHVSPISNNGLYARKTNQTNPNFGARLDKFLVKQMINETSPLKALDIKTVMGVLSLPAAIVAKMTLGNKPSVENEEVGVYTIKNSDLYSLYLEQDEDGKTLAHKQLTPEIIKVLNNRLSSEQFERVFTVKDKDGNAPVSAELGDAMLDTINNSNMPLESAINIIYENGLDRDFEVFLKSRLEKQEQMGREVSSHINGKLYDELQKKNRLCRC